MKTTSKISFAFVTPSPAPHQDDMIQINMSSAMLDAHAKPPSGIREVYKKYQQLRPADMNGQQDLVQSTSSTPSPLLESCPGDDLPDELQHIFDDFLQHEQSNYGHLECPSGPAEPRKVYHVPAIPGLLVYPSLLPPDLQLSLLSRLLHRDLPKPQHQTNVHLHYDVPYPPDGHSYFSRTSSDLIFTPKDSSIHRTFTTKHFLTKKLRWTTLGGQYDWTNKVYPNEKPPAFPEDIKSLVEAIFPMKAEAAIVNFYSPGDTLSLHRDVSEECNRPLVSISFGCDAIFVCGLDETENTDGPNVVAIRLRSGDAILMSGESRFAWHGVPKVVPGTCPEWMQDWPGDEFADWKGWMKDKRINLNIRQMFE